MKDDNFNIHCNICPRPAPKEGDQHAGSYLSRANNLGAAHWAAQWVI